MGDLSQHKEPNRMAHSSTASGYVGMLEDAIIGRHQPTSTRDQLDAVGQQLQQDSQALLNNTDEYVALRRLQLELDTIRARRTAGADQVQAALASLPAPNGTNPQVPLVGTAANQQSLPGFRTLTNLHSVPGEQVLQASSDQLPPGLTLPEGWSMLPLQPSGPPMTQMPLPHGPGPHMMPQPMGQQFQAQFQGPMPIPDHIRAMFSNMPGQQNTAQPGIPGQPTDGQGQNSIAQQPAQGQNQQLPVGGPADIFNMMRAQANGSMPNGNMVNMGTGDLQRPPQAPGTEGVTNGTPAGQPQDMNSANLSDAGFVPRTSSQRPREGTEADFNTFSQPARAEAATNEQAGITTSAQSLPSWGSGPSSDPTASNGQTQTASDASREQRRPHNDLSNFYSRGQSQRLSKIWLKTLTRAWC